MTFWLLIIQIYNPCCDISVTRFATLQECEAAKQIIHNSRFWYAEEPHGIQAGCEGAIVDTEGK